MAYLKRDIFSLLEPTQCYARAVQEVTLVSTSGRVAIIKAPSGLRYGFSCSVDDLTDDPVAMAAAKTCGKGGCLLQPKEDGKRLSKSPYSKPKSLYSTNDT